MAAFDREEIEKLLVALEDQGALFPEFSLVREGNGLRLLGSGGSSAVYEMISRNNHQTHYALKVMGLQSHMSLFEDFRAAAQAHGLLREQTPYVVRILEVKKLWLRLTEKGEICGLWEKDPPENPDNCLNPQFMLMEKLESILTRDRFGKVALLNDALKSEDEVLKLGFQIGQALLCAHKNQILHRDVKLENIFWDPQEECYKLGDFGAAKITRDGSAETRVFSNGYGAPEIQRVLTQNYDATADIYSLGITLYLLLNNLKFPGSDGYYPREFQYHENFTFPKPENASEAVTRVLLKMCAYRKEDRYGSMAEVLAELTRPAETHAEKWENPVWMDLPTETYRGNTPASGVHTEPGRGGRAARLERDRAEAWSSKRANFFFLPAFTAVFYLVEGIFAPDALSMSQWQFWLFPAALLLEALLLKVRGLRIPAGLLAVGMMIGSGISTGFSLLHVLALVYLLAGMEIPLLSLAAAVFLWAFLPPEQLGITGLIQQNRGWLLLTLLLAMSHRAAVCPGDKKTGRPTVYGRGSALMSWLPFLLAGVGIIFWLRQWIWKLPMPEILRAVHPIRTALCGFLLHVMQYMVWYEPETEEEETE